MNINGVKLRILTISFICLSFYNCSLNPYPQGKVLYTSYCENCHAEDGTGLKRLIPPVVNSDYLSTKFNELPCLIRYGISDTLLVNGIAYTQPMEGFPHLTETEISNILNYIQYNFNRDKKVISENWVQEQIANCD